MADSAGIEILKKRFKDWAVNYVLFTRKLSQEPEFRAARNQMVRCGPSCAANYRVACRAKSGPDFINKLKIIEEELDESIFWLEYLIAIDERLEPDTVLLAKEANELLSIIVASLKTARSHS